MTPSKTDPQHGAPTWDVALLFPAQGSWSEAEYLALDSSRLVEFDDGYLEVHSMPNLRHQLIVKRIFQLLEAFVASRGLGTVLFAPLPVRLWEGKYREPDVVFLRPERLGDLDSQPHGADLVMEVVSEGKKNRDRDLTVKREEYARAGVAEYWIVDPDHEQITVLSLANDTYDEIGVFQLDDEAYSRHLEGFRIPVRDVL